MGKIKIQQWQSIILNLLFLPFAILIALGELSKKILTFVDEHIEVVK